MIGSMSPITMEAGRILSGRECKGVEAAPNICRPELEVDNFRSQIEIFYVNESSVCAWMQSKVTRPWLTCPQVQGYPKVSCVGFHIQDEATRTRTYPPQ